MSTIGKYIGQRLIDLDIKEYFAIPGDFNLVLLDEVLKVKSLKMINCCNELNAGYAADGYARVHGISALFLTFGVGGLSAVNAIAGAFAENLPILVFSGGPNTHSLQQSEILHHTLGDENHLFAKNIYDEITAQAIRIFNPVHAARQIDEAISLAVERQKPVYIEISCNIANANICDPTKRSFVRDKVSDQASLDAAVSLAAEKLNAATKPVIVLGPKTRSCHVLKEVEKLAEKTQYALAAMPDAKGFISEQHPNYIGVYWAAVSSPGCAEIVNSSDSHLMIGVNANDYTTVGHSWGIKPEQSVSVNRGVVTIGEQVFTNVFMHDFISGLMHKLTANRHALTTYQRIKGAIPAYIEPESLDEPVATRYLFAQIQQMLSDKTALLAETGDSWFNCMHLNLPEGCPFEIQMQYGSIGWSVGALLGMQAALHNKQRVIACIGDGSFQMSAQEISSLIRYGYKPIIFLMNNASYTIEVQIHDGPYNIINNWRYAELIHVFRGEQTDAKQFTVTTCQELLDAIKQAQAADSLCFIEVKLDKDDCNKRLLEWGSRVASHNGRKLT